MALSHHFLAAAAAADDDDDDDDVYASPSFAARNLSTIIQHIY